MVLDGSAVCRRDHQGSEQSVKKWQREQRLLQPRSTRTAPQFGQTVR